MSSNDQKFSFQVEGQPFELPHEKVPVKDILEQVKKSNIATSTHQSIENLTSKNIKNKVYSYENTVNLSEDNNFSIGIKIKIKVNGQELEIFSEKLIASDIINISKEKGITISDNKTENIRLEAIGTGQAFKNDEWINFTEFDEFLLILDKPTPVAY